MDILIENISLIKILLFVFSTVSIIIAFVLNLNKSSKEDYKFLLFSIIISIFLIGIIEFKIHLFLKYNLGIGKMVSYSLYLLIFVYFIKKFKANIKKYNIKLFYLSFFFFGLAASVDWIFGAKIIQTNKAELIEELIFLLGALAWFYFYFLVLINKISFNRIK